jgi:thiol-disulfide isomerase/thioredoxin
MIAAGPPAKRPPHIAFLGAFRGGLLGWSAWFGTVALMLLLALMPSFSAPAAAEEEKIRLGEFIPATPPQPAPEASFTDIDGKPASLADFKGKAALVNLWATWCEPCRREMPSLERLQAELGDKIIVAAVAEDRQGAKLVSPFIAEMGLEKLKIYLDPRSELGHAFKVRGLPTSIVIDPAGQVVGRVEGEAKWDSAKMQAVLRPFLDSEATTLKKASR